MGLSRNIWGRASLVWRSDVLFLLDNHRWPYSFGPLATSRVGADGVITGVAVDVGYDESMCPKRSWGILDQLDTRGLFQGILDLRRPKTWCHWSLHMQWLCYAFCNALTVVMAIVWFLFNSSCVSLYWSQYHCLRSVLFVMVNGLVTCGQNNVSCIIMISSLSESVGIVITWKLYDWYGLIHFTFLLLCILLLIRNIVSWNPYKSSDFHSILADFTFVYCEICGFQLNPQYF